MKNKFFESLHINGKEYKIAGGSLKGSSYVRILKNVHDPLDELIIKINIKPESKVRFENEIKFLASNKSSYFPELITSGYIRYTDLQNTFENGEYAFYVMPKYQTSLAEYNVNGLSYIRRLKLFLKICKAVAKLHSKGIIHRDIKPGNILIDNDRVLLCDFGIAQFPDLNITVPGERLANSNYCAPEQRKIPYPPFGKYTDTYALGLILNELFTQKIINGNNYTKIRDVAPSYAVLDDIVALMIENDYSRRNEDVSSIIYLINQYINDRNQLEKLYISLMKKSINTRQSNRIIKMLADDCICIYFLAKKIKDLSSLNVHYHSNIHCRVNSDFVRSMVILSAIQNKLFIYFNNENKNAVSFYKQNSNWDTCDKTQFDIFESILEPYSSKQTEIEINRVKRLFINLRSYHAEEFIRTAKDVIKEMEEQLNDSPIFFLASLINRFCRETVSVANIGQFVEPILDLSDSEPIDTNVFCKQKSDEQNVKYRIKKIYGDKIIVAISDYEFSIIFKTKKHSIILLVFARYIKTHLMLPT